MDFMISEKGRKLILYQDNKFRKDRVTDDGVAWRCTQKICKARLYTDFPETGLLRTVGEHCHGTCATIKRELLRNRAKRKAIEDISVSPSKILRKEMEEASDIAGELTKKDVHSIQRAIYYTRKSFLTPLEKNRPLSSKDMYINSELLIEAVESKPAIWDKRIDDYLDKEKKKKAWEEVGEYFIPEGATEEEKQEIIKNVQLKWKNLRDRYARFDKALKSGKQDKMKAPYIFAQHLSFLSEVIDFKTIPKTTTTALPAEVLMEEDDESSLASTSTDPPKRKLDDEIIEALRASKQAKEEERLKDSDDDWQFLRSLYPIMKQIPPHLKIPNRIEIMTVLQKHSTDSYPYEVPLFPAT